MSVSITHAVMVDCVLMVSTNTLASVYRDLLEITVRLVCLIVKSYQQSIFFWFSLWFYSKFGRKTDLGYASLFDPFSILYFFLSLFSLSLLLFFFTVVLVFRILFGSSWISLFLLIFISVEKVLSNLMQKSSLIWNIPFSVMSLVT